MKLLRRIGVALLIAGLCVANWVVILFIPEFDNNFTLFGSHQATVLEQAALAVSLLALVAGAVLCLAIIGDWSLTWLTAAVWLAVTLGLGALSIAAYSIDWRTVLMLLLTTTAAWLVTRFMDQPIRWPGATRAVSRVSRNHRS